MELPLRLPEARIELGQQCEVAHRTVEGNRRTLRGVLVGADEHYVQVFLAGNPARTVMVPKSRVESIERIHPEGRQ